MKYLITCLLITLTIFAQAQPPLLATAEMRTQKFAPASHAPRAFGFDLSPNAEHQRKHFENGEAVWYALGIFGGYLVCRTIGRAMAQKDHNWAVAGVGGGLVCLGVTCAIMEHSRRKRLRIAPSASAYSFVTQNRYYTSL